MAKTKTDTAAPGAATVEERVEATITALGNEIAELERRLADVAEDAPFAPQIKAELENGIKAAKAELARLRRSK